jgi:hypothetical protein
MTIHDLINKFLELLRFMPYIQEDYVKFWLFRIFSLESYKDRIKFDNPESLSEVFRKDRMFYDQ